MVAVISSARMAVRWTLWSISDVAFICSRTTEAMVSWVSLTRVMTSATWEMALEAASASAWMPATWPLISSVAWVTWWERSLTSLATTANPLPAAPARAASMVALRASRLVCLAMEEMRAMTPPIRFDDSPRLVTMDEASRASRAPSAAMAAASPAARATSSIEAESWAEAEATVWILADTSDEELAAAWAWSAASAALAVIWVLTAASCSEAEAISDESSRSGRVMLRDTTVATAATMASRAADATRTTVMERDASDW